MTSRSYLSTVLNTSALTMRSTLLCLGTSLLLSACGGSDDNTVNSPNLPSNPPSPNTPDETEADTDWLPAGGNATITADISRPFLQIMPNLPSSALGGVSPGRELFITDLMVLGHCLMPMPAPSAIAQKGANLSMLITVS